MTKSGNIFSVIVVLLVVVLGVYWFMANRSPDLSNDIEPAPVPQMEGKVEDLVEFSVYPGYIADGTMYYHGSIQGGWFFEANILINILDANKNVIKSDHATATSDWQTAGPVQFEGTIDFFDLPKGPAYFEIHNDNASGLPEYDKWIRIPIVIK